MNYKSISRRTDWTHWNQFSSWTPWESQQNWKQNNKNTWIYIAPVHILQNKNQEQDSSSRFSKLDGGFWAWGRCFNNIFIKAVYSEKKMWDNLQNGWLFFREEHIFNVKASSLPSGQIIWLTGAESVKLLVEHTSPLSAPNLPFCCPLQHQQFWNWHLSDPSCSQVIIII